MKKLVMAAVIALAAVATQAATTKWSTTAVTFNGTKLGGQTVNLYIVGIDGADDELFDTRTTLATPAGQRGKLTGGVGDLQKDVLYSSTVAGGTLANDEGEGVWSDAGREYYMVITYKSGETTYTYTSSSVASSGLSAKSQGSVSFTFSDTISTVEGTKDAWVAVPEPTSGLLLLLGVAGLALKRKQK